MDLRSPPLTFSPVDPLPLPAILRLVSHPTPQIQILELALLLLPTIQAAQKMVKLDLSSQQAATTRVHILNPCLTHTATQLHQLHLLYNPHTSLSLPLVQLSQELHLIQFHAQDLAQA